jgi:penicillin-binding protein 1A
LNPRLKKILLITAGILLLLCIPPIIFFFMVYNGYFGKVYTGKELRALQSYVASDVYSSDKKLLGKYYWENRSNIDAKHLPSFLVSALVATEDARFFEHNGIDTKGMLRVFFKTLLMHERNAGGGSTIGQQLAKNLLKRQDHGWLTMPVNKIKEAIHAVRFSKVYTPNEILALYLNTVSLGEDTYGIKNASMRFFNTSYDSLRIEQAAVLIGMLKSPTRYNPRMHPELSLQRRNVVIENMEYRGYLKQHIGDSLKKLPLRIHYNHSGTAEGIAPYFLAKVEQITNNLLDSIKGPQGKKYNLYTDGLKIYTTLDHDLQVFAIAAMKKHMQQLQAQFDRYWKNGSPWGRNAAVISTAIKNTQRFKSLSAQHLKQADISKAFKTPAETELFDWNGGHKAMISPIDSIKYYAKLLQSGFLAMDPHNGQIKAWVGGDDFGYFQYDHVTAKRQVGSTFKPIVFANALEQGVSPCDYFRNDKKVYDEYGGWSPENAEDEYGGKYSLRGALAHSVNVVSVDVLLQAGIDRTVRLAHNMGIESEIPEVPSIALGVADISLLEMVRAYCTFPNGGRKTEAVFITRIEDRSGKVIYRAPEQKEGKQIISRQSAYYMNQMLKAVVNEGTASALRGEYHFREEIAGKTGTTQSQADGWFIGFSPNLVAGVWVGAESPSVHFNSISYGQGAHMALPIWGLFFQKVKADKHTKHYISGTFPYSSDLSRMPACESFVEDNFFDKLKNFFHRGKDGKVVKDIEEKPKEKKKHTWFWER